MIWPTAEVRLNGDFDPSKLLTSGAPMNYGAVADSQLDELISAYLSANDDDRRTACDNMCLIFTKIRPTLCRWCLNAISL